MGTKLNIFIQAYEWLDIDIEEEIIATEDRSIMNLENTGLLAQIIFDLLKLLQIHIVSVALY